MAKWIQKAHAKKGELSRALNIQIEDNIPLTLLDAIIDAETGDVITNPTESGKRRIRITTKIQRQASLARTLRRLR